MTDPIEENRDSVLKDFQAALGRSNYAFKYSLLKLNADLNRQRLSAWQFAVANLPVEAQGKEAHIDFILRHSEAYMLAKCVIKKPTHPNWCFAKAPYKTGYSSSERVIVEGVKVDENNQMNVCIRHTYTDRRLFHVALEVKSGDPEGKEKRTTRSIEWAMIQLGRELSGFINIITSNLQLFPPKAAYFKNERAAILLPVIFTTADLWTTDADLSNGHVESGNIDLSQSEFTKEPWILFQYHVSSAAKHALALDAKPKTLGEFVEIEHLRTVAVVSPSGVADFLRWAESFETY